MGVMNVTMVAHYFLACCGVCCWLCCRFAQGKSHYTFDRTICLHYCRSRPIIWLNQLILSAQYTKVLFRTYFYKQIPIYYKFEIFILKCEACYIVEDFDHFAINLVNVHDKFIYLMMKT